MRFAPGSETLLNLYVAAKELSLQRLRKRTNSAVRPIRVRFVHDTKESLNEK